jgi:hypothetical protein
MELEIIILSKRSTERQEPCDFTDMQNLRVDLIEVEKRMVVTRGLGERERERERCRKTDQWILR